MFCQHCGHEIDNDATFCPNCGTKVNTESAPAPQGEKDEFFKEAPAPAPVQQQSAAPQPTPYAQTQQPAKTNTFAIIGFVLSFFGYVALAGLIFSIIGLKQCNKTQEKGKGLAIAGIVISSVVLFINLIVNIFTASYDYPYYGYDYY